MNNRPRIYRLVLIPVCLFFPHHAESQIFASGPADSVTVTMFADFWQVDDPCKAVGVFRSVASGEDFSKRFVGCSAKSIPFDTYDVDLRSETFDTRSAKSPKYRCVVDQPRTVCALVFSSPDLIYADTRVKLRGLKDDAVAILSAAAVRSDWHRTLSADSNGEFVVRTIWKELMIAVIVDGEAIGSVYLDLKRVAKARTITVVCDTKKRRVSIVPEASSAP